ncbi:AlpA family phage regulatory protein [Burkholderia vietnamiensis]|jgi:prophage regulatory protein|nr:AlpA family phage regulatory protein [Burkholderia vietnamiensis]AOJ17037.1 DNA-binding protein [Burkholderia vietnamiensis]KVE70802.1 DNA-binding protein [Burkholderia vietnamiensis]MBR7973948.1 AlpA family phage regulatory protein [Burkholderia vietnamiensis]MBR8051740.1 AlpA family phage regulatory protein [Burkholderia vietnamiensis]MBR8216875.1 AlpA family phage regulatory protein [Burkholderia vietnamiensis]
MRCLLGRVGLSKSEIYRRIQAGAFPKPIPLGTRAVGWLESDINAWIDTQAKRGQA